MFVKIQSSVVDFEVGNYKLVQGVTAIQILHKSENDCRNFCKFSDRQVWANSADPDQTGAV